MSAVEAALIALRDALAAEGVDVAHVELWLKQPDAARVEHLVTGWPASDAGVTRSARRLAGIIVIGDPAAGGNWEELKDYVSSEEK